MGLQDRDYYREEIKKRDTKQVFETARKAAGVGNFRFAATPPASASSWVGVLLRVVILCLAVYGALALIRDFRYGLKPWTKLDPDRVQRLLPYLSGK